MLLPLHVLKDAEKQLDAKRKRNSIFPCQSFHKWGELPGLSPLLSMRRHKFNAVRTEVDGILFDSKKEAKRYDELKLLERGGIIKDLKLQPKFELTSNGVNIVTDKNKKYTYIADFMYFDNEKGETVIEDAKGMKTPIYKLKKAIMRTMGYEIVEV